MDVLDQAMDIEKDGESLYRQFSMDASDQGMKTVFTWLADQEKKHCEIFREMKAGKNPAVKESMPLRDLENIFDSWKEIAKHLSAKISQASIYREALDMENKSILVYENYANASAAPGEKDVFLAIVKEEKRHRWVLENIIGFVTKPEVWAENAEFSHLEKDYYL